MRVGYYGADAQGVFFAGDIIEDPETDVIPPRMFLDHIIYVDKEIVYTFFDESRREIYDEVMTQHGIRDAK